MNPQVIEGRLIAHRRILQLMLSELAGTPAGDRLKALLDERSSLQDGQEDPGAVETAGMGVELAVAEEFRQVADGLRPSGSHDPSYVRDAGPEAMREPPADWSAVDEAEDESFPASDPPAR